MGAVVIGAGHYAPRKRTAPADPPKRTLHPIVAELRAAALAYPGGMAAVADVAGYDAYPVQAMLRGAVPPNLHMVVDVAQVLGLDVRLVPR